MTKTKQTYKNKWQAAYRQKPEVKVKRREEKYLERYRMTLTDYTNLLVKQGGACAICNGSSEPFIYFDVDHDHVTGQVRGLLCRKCNNGLGSFQDSLDLLTKASHYLTLPR